MGRKLSSAVLGLASALSLSIAIAADQPEVLDQGWSKEMRELFYFTPQGSRMMPYAWFVAIEAADSAELFSDATRLARYGFIPPDGPHPLNPGNLPIGFAVDPAPAVKDTRYPSLGADAFETTREGQYVGVTCAACHTANVTVEGRTIRIDGGAANVDFDRFYADLAAAVSRTFFDPDKFQRFATRVLKSSSPTSVAELRLRFADFEARIAGDAVIRKPSVLSGFGRVDALTQIVNAIAGSDQGDPNNIRAVVAPTSYPSLWLTPQLEFVQWNPIAGSPIGRNGGEVLGVFGTATLTGDPSKWFSSSLLIKELHALETWINELKPPKWQQTLFGPIDVGLASTGQTLVQQYCTGCHNAPPYRRTDPQANYFKKTFIEIGRVNFRAVGTDPTYVEALVQRLVRTNPATARLHDGQAVVPAPTYFLKTAGAIVGRAMDDAGLSDEEKAAVTGFRLRPPLTPGAPPLSYSPPSVTDLKAGPLAGIWATGPYLHNGSVPTIYELLSPLAERRTVFWVGGRELDRTRLGFVSDDAPGRFRFDTRQAGNRNTGHFYPGTGLTHEQRLAIIEYLKTQ